MPHKAAEGALGDAGGPGYGCQGQGAALAARHSLGDWDARGMAEGVRSFIVDTIFRLLSE